MERVGREAAEKSRVECRLLVVSPIPRNREQRGTKSLELELELDERGGPVVAVDDRAHDDLLHPRPARDAVASLVTLSRKGYAVARGGRLLWPLRRAVSTLGVESCVALIVDDLHVVLNDEHVSRRKRPRKAASAFS